jgi:hypothetical protein
MSINIKIPEILNPSQKQIVENTQNQINRLGNIIGTTSSELDDLNNQSTDILDLIKSLIEPIELKKTKKKYLKHDENVHSQPKLDRDAKHLYLKYDQISEGNHDPSLDIFSKKKYLKYKSKYLKLKNQI